MAVKFCDKCGTNVPIPHLTCQEEQTLYGFWKNDHPPYILGGTIRRFGAGGYIETKEFPTFRFKPIAILPDSEGAEAIKVLDKLYSAFSEELKELRLEYRILGLKAIGLHDEAQPPMEELKKLQEQK